MPIIIHQLNTSIHQVSEFQWNGNQTEEITSGYLHCIMFSFRGDLFSTRAFWMCCIACIVGLD
jgi:hypothetical protein